jgi:hypothetical protein
MLPHWVHYLKRFHHFMKTPLPSRTLEMPSPYAMVGAFALGSALGTGFRWIYIDVTSAPLWKHRDYYNE